MSIFSNRLFALIIKELLTIFRDPKGRTVLIIPPLLQLLIFAYAVTLEVKNIPVVILNQDMGKHSNEIIQRIHGSPSFSKINFIQSVDEFKPYIDQQQAIAGINIPQDFSKNIDGFEKQATIQVILDGRRSNAAQIVSSYIAELVNNYTTELDRNTPNPNNQISIMPRNWFNQNLLYVWYTVPSLVGILPMTVGLIIASLSVARERELGTFDQMLVSPLLPHEILLGKTIPAVIVGIAEGLLIGAVGVILFGVPFVGSFPLLLFAMTTFIISIVGVGIFISSLAKTQQQAILGNFVFIVPTITLSGYSSPVENMPIWLQKLTWFDPLKHQIIITKGIFLKNMHFIDIWENLWPMLIIGGLTLTLAGWSFTRRLE